MNSEFKNIISTKLNELKDIIATKLDELKDIMTTSTKLDAFENSVSGLSSLSGVVIVDDYSSTM